MHAHRFRSALSLLAVLALAGCASLQVQTDYDDLASLTQLRTYNWINSSVYDAPNGDGDNEYVTSDPAVNSPLVDQRIRRAIDAELTRRGYVKVTSGTPDFRVAYSVATEKSTDYYGSTYYGGYSPYYGSYARNYLEGVLVVDVVDGHTNQVIWRGWASDLLDDDPSPKEVHEYITAAIEGILERFPPGARMHSPSELQTVNELMRLVRIQVRP